MDSCNGLPAIRFEREAFEITGSKIMGRQAAGAAFLRAIVENAGNATITGFGPHQKGSEFFTEAIRQFNPTAKSDWVSAADHHKLSKNGGLHLPDPSLGEYARTRLVQGSDSYFLSGITHTLASRASMEAISNLVAAPIFPWDALICTSKAVYSVVDQIMSQTEDFFRWRFKGVKPSRPQLPIIPLGVHCPDFDYSDADKQNARSALKISPDEVVILFLGRLSFHAKANPFPMYLAAEQVAVMSGKPIVMIQCGWCGNQHIENAFREGAKRFAPSIRHLWLDGRKAERRELAWASGDIFCSLSDNIQETFGLTPLEAMACGMPVIASDWNGYKDIVQHGTSGFLAPTFVPSSEWGERYIDAYIAGSIDYDRYIGMVSQHASIDLKTLIDQLQILVENRQIRLQMGTHGKRIAKSNFEWNKIVCEYFNLWQTCREIKESAALTRQAIKLRAGDRLNPFKLFSHYPSELITPDTQVEASHLSLDWGSTANDPLFLISKPIRPRKSEFLFIMQFLGDGKVSTVDDIAQTCLMDIDKVIIILSYLAKWGAIQLGVSPPNVSS